MSCATSGVRAIGRFIEKYRWVIIAGWVVVAAAMAAFSGRENSLAAEEDTFLPAGTPSTSAYEALKHAFPTNSGLSKAVIVFERRDGELTGEDRSAIERIASRIAAKKPLKKEVSREDLEGITVRSPQSVGKNLPFTHNPLFSNDGKAAIVEVNIPASFITLPSARVVRHIRAIIAEHKMPAGLDVAVTGSSAFGNDYAEAAERSNRQSMLVTIIAVVVILLLVYRSPIAAAVPLGAITVAAIIVIHLFIFAASWGMHVGTAEKIFVFVLLYGAGVDYSLLYISRYREMYDDGVAHPAGEALNASAAAIGASSGTDAAGLLMLCFAKFGIFRTTGPAVAVALVVALAASMTLVPALVAAIGQRMFWPAKHMGQIGRRRLWPAFAKIITARPALLLIIAIAALAAPAVQGTRLTWVYDTLAAIKSDEYDSARGAEMARRHWSVGEIAPATLLIQGDRNKAPTSAQWTAAATRISRAVKALPGVEDVRSLNAPLGQNASSLTSVSIGLLGRSGVEAEYLSPNHKAMRLIVVLKDKPLTLEAMHAVSQIRQAAEKELAHCDGIGTEIHISGATAEMMDVREVTQKDFHLIAVLALGVIFIIIFALLRDVILSAFMILSTLLSYFAALGISYWVFTALLGGAGLDWKVEVFLFVVMVAVGVDYNIFLAARLAQEARIHPPREAMQRAIIHTGPVISSCGIIMAATLGSLMAGDLTLLQQLGFAFAVGMLIDTFIGRPLIVPAFAMLTKRVGRKRPSVKSADSPAETKADS